MSDPAAPAPTPDPAPAGPSLFSVRRILLATIPAALVAGVAYAAVTIQNKPPAPVDLASALKGYLEHQGAVSTLTAGYTDADGDLVADAPTDPAQLINPAEIAFTVVGADNPADAEPRWKPFMDHLARTTGKPVVYLKTPAPPPEPPAPKAEGADDEAPSAAGPTSEAIGIEGQVDAMKAGRLHVTAFNTGAVEGAVNTAGFVPLFCPADATGKFAYEMEIIVPAASPAKTPADLRGQTLAFVTMSSNSGSKAPLVRLKEEFKMLPGHDYNYVLTGDHKRSVAGVAAGKFAAASVANDILQQMTEKGDVKADQYRSVYKSNPFPPLCFGVPYNLDPKVRAAVEKAFETFQFEGTPLGTYYAAQKRVKFAKVEYKKDFAFVRDVDAKLAKLFAPN